VVAIRETQLKSAEEKDAADVKALNGQIDKLKSDADAANKAAGEREARLELQRERVAVRGKLQVAQHATAFGRLRPHIGQKPERPLLQCHGIVAAFERGRRNRGLVHATVSFQVTLSQFTIQS
jgi:hypothetical protein